MSNFTNILNCGEKAKRCSFRLYIDKSPFDQSNQHWQLIGSGMESLDIETNYDETTTTDVLCVTSTTINKVEKTTSFTPLYFEGCNDIAQELYEKWVGEDWDNLYYSLMLVNDNLEKNGESHAVVYDKSLIRPKKFGGKTYMEIEADITFGGNKIEGTATKDKLNPVFTPKTTQNVSSKNNRINTFIE